MEEQHEPTIIKRQREWASKPHQKPSPYFDMQSQWYGVFNTDDWPWWERLLLRTSGSPFWLPPRVQ